MDGFDSLLASSTQAVPANYFQLPVAGQEDPSYRERVYCYELYHQLRCRWPMDTSYSLAGEVDKRGHPLVRGNGLDNVKPDLLVHIPGDMGGNFAAVEVKSVLPSSGGLAKDLRTLTAFRSHAGYARAILLIYGTDEQVPGLLDRLTEIAAANQDLIQQDGIEIWRHTAPSQAAFRIG